MTGSTRPIHTQTGKGLGSPKSLISHVSHRPPLGIRDRMQVGRAARAGRGASELRNRPARSLAEDRPGEGGTARRSGDWFGGGTEWLAGSNRLAQACHRATDHLPPKPSRVRIGRTLAGHVALSSPCRSSSSSSSRESRASASPPRLLWPRARPRRSWPPPPRRRMGRPRPFRLPPPRFPRRARLPSAFSGSRRRACPGRPPHRALRRLTRCRPPGRRSRRRRGPRTRRSACSPR